MDSVTASVIMTAFNAEKYIAEAIESILNQTFADFEFIIVDDASTDNTSLIIQRFTDSRIIVIRNVQNEGVAKSSNIGLRYAKGKYIIRADADDINLAERFEKQIEYMEKHPKIMLSSCSMVIFGENEAERKRIIRLNEQQIKANLIFNSVLPHPGFIFRREVCAECGYDETIRYALDYDFQVRASLKYPISCMEDIYVRYRHSDTQISTQKYKEQQEHADVVRKRMFQYYGILLTDNELKCIQLLSTGRIKDMTSTQFLVAFKLMFELKYKVKKSRCAEKSAICDLCDEMNYKVRKEIIERINCVLGRN